MRYVPEAPECMPHMLKGLESMRGAVKVVEDIRHVSEMPEIVGNALEVLDVM